MRVLSISLSSVRQDAALKSQIPQILQQQRQVHAPVLRTFLLGPVPFDCLTSVASCPLSSRDFFLCLNPVYSVRMDFLRYDRYL